MKRAGVCLFLTLMFGLLAAQPAFALSCAPPREPMEEKGFSDIVFKGKLISETRDKLFFQVDKVWKGDVGQKITLYQNFWTDFKTGEQYVIFAGVDEGKLRPKLCGNTKLASQFNEAALGESIPLAPKNAGSFAIGLPAGLIAVVVLAAILFILLRKKRIRS